MKHPFRIALGIILVTIGVIGGLIPIFQGWVFGIPGLIILADYFPPAKKLLDWAKKKSGYSNKKNKKNDELNFKWTQDITNLLLSIYTPVTNLIKIFMNHIPHDVK